MHLVRIPCASVSGNRPTVKIRVDRWTLSKRRWRAQADDGTDFGFDVPEPLADGAAVLETAEATYVISQTAEPLLAIPLAAPSAAARAAWQIGNLHFPMCVEGDVILAPDDPALRQLFQREKMNFHEVTAVFRCRARASGHYHQHHNDLHSHEHH